MAASAARGDTGACATAASTARSSTGSGRAIGERSRSSSGSSRSEREPAATRPERATAASSETLGSRQQSSITAAGTCGISRSELAASEARVSLDQRRSTIRSLANVPGPRRRASSPRSTACERPRQSEIQWATRALPVSRLSALGRLVITWTISVERSASSAPRASGALVDRSPNPTPTPRARGPSGSGSWLVACAMSVRSSSGGKYFAARKAPSSSSAEPAARSARLVPTPSTPPSRISRSPAKRREPTSRGSASAPAARARTSSAGSVSARRARIIPARTFDATARRTRRDGSAASFSRSGASDESKALASRKSSSRSAHVARREWSRVAASRSASQPRS